MFLQRIGYLAASQCFHESTDVIMLTTNQIRKVSDFYLSVPSTTVIHPPANFFRLMDFSSFNLVLSQDLSSPNQYDTGVALTGLSCFVTPDLARDLANDIMTLVSYGECVKRFITRISLWFFFSTTTPHLYCSSVFVYLRSL